MNAAATGSPAWSSAEALAVDLGSEAGAAVARLYERERPRMLRLAFLFVGDRALAEDLVHDAFVNLTQRWSRLDDPARAGGYLSVSVANGARSMLRRRRTAVRRSRLDRIEAADPADAPALLAAEYQQIVEAVRQLPTRQRQIIALRYWAELSEAQIAEALGISAGTVKSGAARALAKLHHVLEDCHD